MSLDASAVVQRYEDGRTLRECAAEFGCSMQRIHQIIQARAPDKMRASHISTRPRYGARKKTTANIPIVREACVILRNDPRKMYDVHKAAGISATTTNKWRTSTSKPRIDLFVKVLNALGYDLKIVKREAA